MHNITYNIMRAHNIMIVAKKIKVKFGGSLFKKLENHTGQ